MSLTPFYHKGGYPLFSRMFDDFENYLGHKRLGTRDIYIPKFDVQETKDKYQLKGELPGVKQKDIEIEYSVPNTMHITGHTENSFEEKDGSSWISERSIGTFQRSFTFPSPVNQNAIHAHLQDGILSITVPKAAETSNNLKIKVDEWSWGVFLTSTQYLEPQILYVS